MKIYFKKKIPINYFKNGTSQFDIVEYLTESGKYTMKNNKLVKYNLENLDGTDKELHNGFVGSSEIWKRCEDVFNIPYNHVKIVRSITKYKYNDNLYYVEELINNEITSNYILTTYRLGDSRLNDILKKL